MSVGFVEALRGCERELTVSGRDGQRRTVKVRIPAGMESGGKVRVRGKGQPGGRGGPPGDIMLTVVVQEHEHFWREGGALHVTIPIRPGDAVRGGKVRVPTPSGGLKVKVPAGSQSGDKLRLRGKGGPTPRGGAVDLIVHLQVRMPEAEVGEEVLAALEVLDAAVGDELGREITFD